MESPKVCLRQHQVGMANSKNLLLCLILLVLLCANKLESRPLEQKKNPEKAFRELVEKSQPLNVISAKQALIGNRFESMRLSPEGPDPRHH